MNKETALMMQIAALRRRYLIKPSYALERKIKNLVAELETLQKSKRWEEFLSR